jgi:hypothetical protein
MMPFFGTHIAYQPIERVVGLLEAGTADRRLSLRLQTQENLPTRRLPPPIEKVLAAGRRSDAAGRAYLHVLARCAGRCANGDDAVSRNFPLIRRSRRFMNLVGNGQR